MGFHAGPPEASPSSCPRRRRGFWRASLVPGALLAVGLRACNSLQCWVGHLAAPTRTMPTTPRGCNVLAPLAGTLFSARRRLRKRLVLGPHLYRGPARSDPSS